jgi:hypothetical protein
MHAFEGRVYLAGYILFNLWYNNIEYRSLYIPKNGFVQVRLHSTSKPPFGVAFLFALCFVWIRNTYLKYV